MRFVVDASFLTSLLVLASSNVSNPAVVAAMSSMPPSHPSESVLAKFSPHFRCPYAEEWMRKGPKQAALDLGLHNKEDSSSKANSVSKEVPSKRSLRRQKRILQQDVVGSCAYTDSFSGQPTCFNMQGDMWTDANMQTRCANEGDAATLSLGVPCTTTDAFTGYCIAGEQPEMIEATAFGGMSCDQSRNVCETFVRGVFEASDECLASSTTTTTANGEEQGAPQGFPFSTSTASNSNGECVLAPGAIGAAHQAGYSSGYGTNCEGTPSQGSPYMWQVAWGANVESESMPFGTDDVLFHSRGRVNYRLDRNWKRQDWFYQRGVQRFFGQGPCEPENVVDYPDEGIKGCRRDSDEYTTMIHRGSKMFFITWKNDTQVGSNDPAQISECNWMDLQVVGNIRPDWFMDDLGDDTGVQYLGNQHVYHEGVPRMVKQWRKKDFASQYFVMSMLGNPSKEDGIHWPMILNVPGEGFGDDSLQKYSNHTQLTDEDDYLFLLDEALEEIGGTCEQMNGFGGEGSEGGGGIGPPSFDVHIPSHLEVDPNSWFSNIYTYSPIWEPPVVEVVDDQDTNEDSRRAVTEVGEVVVRSCYNATASAVELSVEYTNVQMIAGGEFPWMALGYRPSEECRMNPVDGSDTEIILLTSSRMEEEEEGNQGIDAYFGLLPSAARRFEEGFVGTIFSSLTPLMDKDDFSNVKLQLPTPGTVISKSSGGEGSSSQETNTSPPVTLHFQQRMEARPTAMYLNYAIGSSSEIGFHRSRRCFEVTEFPTCPSVEPRDESQMVLDEESSSVSDNIATNLEASGASSWAQVASFVVVSCIGAVLTIMF